MVGRHESVGLVAQCTACSLFAEFGGRVKPWRVYAVMASVRAIRASLETALAVPAAHLTF